LNNPPATVAEAFAPIATAHCNGPDDEQDELPVDHVPSPVERHASNACADAGATLAAKAVAATAPSTPPATNNRVDVVRHTDMEVRRDVTGDSFRSNG